MLTFNKLFLALAFLGGSAAAQAADGNADVSRTDFGKNSERSDRINGIRRSLTTSAQIGSWSESLSQQHLDHPYDVGSANLSVTVNGAPLQQGNLPARYDVKAPLASTTRLFDASTPVRGGLQSPQSLSLSESQHNYLPVHHVL